MTPRRAFIFSFGPALLPGAAQAHASEQALVLLLPTGLYIAGAASPSRPRSFWWESCRRPRWPRCSGPAPFA